MHFAAVAMLLRACTLRAGGATDPVPAQSRYEATADHANVESVRTTRDALDAVGFNIGDEPQVVATRRAGHLELEHAATVPVRPDRSAGMMLVVLGAVW